MKFQAREGMASAVVALFAYAFWRNPSEQLMLGAIIAAFTTAIGFYLGGSKVGSDTATKNADTLTAIGSSASAPKVQDVHVINPPTNPVPTHDSDIEGERS